MARRGARRPSEDELRLWRYAVRDVDPVGPPAKMPPLPVPTPEAQPKAHPVKDPDEPKSGPRKRGPAPKPGPGKVYTPEAIDVVQVGAPVGLDRRTGDRLRRGKLRVDATLDLHGTGRLEARRVLHGFLMRAQAQGHRVILVITGKGGPSEDGEGRGVIKRSLPQWLNEAPVRDRILAVHKAQPRHGGAGAYYVLLRRTR